ncbi:MAG: OB-fold nucleic acid binding domain-containing protein [Cyanobacteriota bacterium]|nr:OB-fold nucleic acid binding domain-containing protein [Cyanobacteriota bacterium]
MVKIISRKKIGTQALYDIGVERDHNFILKNGTVASNCFNKSHSMAYGYVTYQTAYLKANYPVEYMAALLTANSGNRDKVQKYIATCMNMNIQVEPPDINRSEIDFTPVDGKIVFGLSAVLNLGQGAIECLLAARQEGAFESLADVCERLDLQAVNKRALEALIKCGAFDRIEPNRHQLMQDLELTIDWAQTRARDKASGQGNLFDLMGDAQMASTEDGFEAVPKGQPVEDYDPLTKLRQEKELLGFYVSDHPLKPIQQSARLLAPVSLNELSDRQENSLISAIVMVSGLKPILTKKGDRMAILNLEDLTGQAEGVVFPKSYERIHTCLQADARLIIWGKIDRRDDRTQIVIEDAEPIEQVKMVMVELNPQQAKSIEVQRHLLDILQAHTDKEQLAKVPVVGIVSAGQKRQFVRFGAQFRVIDSTRTVNALNFAQFPAREEPLARA